MGGRHRGQVSDFGRLARFEQEGPLHRFVIHFYNNMRGDAL